MDLWDIGQESRAHEAHNAADRAESKAHKVGDELADMQRQLDHMTLVCQSIWELLRGETGLTEELLRAKIADIDTRDGKPDGKITPSVFPCPSCGANCNSSRQSCVMCGEDLKGHKSHIFEA